MPQNASLCFRKVGESNNEFSVKHHLYTQIVLGKGRGYRGKEKFYLVMHFPTFNIFEFFRRNSARHLLPKAQFL